LVRFLHIPQVTNWPFQWQFSSVSQETLC
jgi:hypothetical protein